MRLLCAIIVAGVMIVAPCFADSSEGQKSARQAITRIEATRLAQRFFDSEIVIEGALGDPSIRGSSWAFPVRLGYAGTVQPAPLLVDRKTGEVSWTGLAAHRAAYGLERREKRR